jgi:peptide/nickel transport system substrate-binding protein
MPAHVLARYSNLNEVPFNQAPTVSDGPFTFVEWSKGDHVTFAANPHFFLGVPKLKEVRLREIPDENTSVNLLRTHDVDWIFEASIHNYQAIAGIPGTRIVWVNVNGYENVGLNLARPLLRDIRVRRAIAYAIDKQLLVNTLTYGQTTIATEDLPNWMWAFNPNIRPVLRDVAKARALLAEAGWNPGPDGIMRKNGVRLSLELVSNNSNATRRQAAVQIQEMLRDAGIEVAIKFFPGQQLFAPAGMGGILQLGQYDLTLSGWFAGIDPDNSTGLMCKYFPPHGWNSIRYCNPEMDAAQTVALESYDRPTRKAAYFKIQELEAQDVPAIFLWWGRQMQPVSDGFKGFDPNPVTESWNAWQWSI